MELEEAINKRRSIRRYKQEPISEQDIKKMIELGCKVPSAGATRSLRIIPVYDPKIKEVLYHAALGQKAVSDGYVVLVIVANYQKVMGRYRMRGMRYAAMEAGHMGQNISLMATSLGLGCVMIGAFRDSEVKKILELETEDPLYIIPVGKI